MREDIRICHKKGTSTDYSAASTFGMETAKEARKYHQSIPGYEPTPLAQLSCLAEELKVGDIFVKDESKRFGLNAFKGLGGSYYLGKYIAGLLGKDLSEVTFEELCSEETRAKVGEITFVAATDGNHGRGIAWFAKLLGHKAVIYLPKGSTKERLENIRACGAQAEITDMIYDDTAEFAAEQAEKNGWVHIQDTDWEGYEEIPEKIMQGYTTMTLEIAEQLGGKRPTHLFLQAGCGSMSGAVTGFFTDLYKENRPMVTIVEPEKADCVYRTAAANDGQLHVVDGDLDTIMAGLSCAVPCGIGWKQLDRFADCFVSLPDDVAAEGMRLLGRPVGTDPVVVSGESGAVTMGFVNELLRDEEQRKAFGIDENSVILCLSTEGDTDKESYRKIMQG